MVTLAFVQWDNSLGAEGGKAIAPALQVMKNMRELDLVSDEGERVLLEGRGMKNDGGTDSEEGRERDKERGDVGGTRKEEM